MEDSIKDLRKRILPILLFCQANKGDLHLFENWKKQKDARIKLFYAYYSGLFCRILCVLESDFVLRSFVRDCNALLDKYHWYQIDDNDLEMFEAGETDVCEVSEALTFIDGVDNVTWKDSGFGNGRDAVCLKMKQSSWTFADVRGSVKVTK